MLIRKISIILNNQNTFWNLHLDIMIIIFVGNNFLFMLASVHCEIGFIVEHGVTEK